MAAGLDQLLERPDEVPFYDLLGGLADNLLTIGPHAGTFLSCDACGDTFCLKDRAWNCEGCGQVFTAKFATPKRPGKPYEATLSGVTNARWNPHWCYENENWSVAEFLTHVLRLRPEEFLPMWFKRLGVTIETPAVLETVLCWPRFRFGGKTIQPDFAVGFARDIVLVEFKRPSGGTVPPVEVMGQVCFAADAARLLGRRWHLVLVPGRDSAAMRTPLDYARLALGAASQASEKWAIPPAALAEVQSAMPERLAASMRVFGWESMLRLTTEAIRLGVPDSWTKGQALTKLRYFHTSRAKLGLLAAPEPV